MRKPIIINSKVTLSVQIIIEIGYISENLSDIDRLDSLDKELNEKKLIKA